MIKYFRNNWFGVFFISLISGVTIFTITKKPLNSELTPQKIVHPKTDSIIAIADSVVTILEIQKKEHTKLKKEKELFEKELKIEKKKKSKPVPVKTKVVVETKEVVVEKIVKLADPGAKEAIIENYRIQNENTKLKEEIETLKKKNKVKNDTISTDTIRSKRKRFLLF
jgi:hypothetical protein